MSTSTKDTGTIERVMKMVKRAIKKNPDISNNELYKRACKMDDSIADLDKRQFHARYPLQVRRAMASGQPIHSKEPSKRPEPEPTEPQDGEVEPDRHEIRAALLAFAREFNAVEGTDEVIDLALDGVEEYVDRILNA